MEYKQIQDLIKVVNKSNIGELTIEEGDFKITIKQKKENIQTFVNPAAYAQPLPAAQPQQPVQQIAQPAIAEENVQSAQPKQDTSNHLVIKSPMIGTFYRKPSPDKPSLVDLGTEITPGQPVCIIEAMKLFNEIESEIAGKIVKILVEDASPVEFDQPLFLVEPN